MKALIFISLFLFGLNSFAEVKPDGALVPTMCGDNVAETPFGGPNYAIRICTYEVTGGNDIDEMKTKRPIFSVENGAGEKTYYMTLGLVQKDFTEWVWQAYKLNVNKGQYTFIDAANPIDLSYPMMELTQLINGGAIRLIGPMLEAELEFVMVTQSQ